MPPRGILQTAVCTRRDVVLVSVGSAELTAGNQRPPNTFSLCRKRARLLIRPRTPEVWQGLLPEARSGKLVVADELRVQARLPEQHAQRMVHHDRRPGH